MKSASIYLVCRALMSVLRRFPRAWAERLVDLLAGLAYILDAHHRRIARTNLRIAFPHLPLRERNLIARRSFRHTGRNLLEVSRLPLLSPSNIAQIVEYDREMGLGNFLKAREGGRTILYLTGHFSAWELLPTAHALYGYPLSFVTRPLDNPRLEQHVLQLRQAAGNKVIYKKNSARRILQSLKKGNPVGILMDQNTSLQEGIYSDLFGVPAATTTSLALLALRTDATVLPGYLTPMRGGRYAIKFRPALELVRTGDLERDVEENTRMFNRVLEEIIRECPEAWLWGHKRWKNQPEGNPDLYRLSPSELERFLEENRQTGSIEAESLKPLAGA